MRQPKIKYNKKSGGDEKLKLKKKKKNNKVQPVTRNILFFKYNRYEPPEEEFESPVTTSKLETLFENLFLKKLKLNYIRQWKGANGRYYDFAILSKYGNEIIACVEVNGDYWHANPKKYDRENGKLYANQKKQILIDEQKKNWVLNNKMAFIEIWEHDIHNNSRNVMNIMKKFVDK